MRINLISPINDLGYGYTGLHITDELIKKGHDVALFPIGRPNCHFRHEDNIKQALENADRWSNDAPCVRIWHQHDMSMFVGHGEHVGFPIFELDTFNEKEKHHLQSCDELFVCSKWAADVCYDNFATPNPPVAVVPLGVDNEIFTPKLSKRKPTIFLNCGKWEVRKGHGDLWQMFNMAFTSEDNVELWMMCNNPFLNDEQTHLWEESYRNSTLGAKIRFLPRVESDMQVAEIMQQADCGVFPSHAEGWNLEALEMLSCGKQVIATDYSAHTEFLTQTNSWLIPTYGVEPAFDGIWFHKQGNWASFLDTTLKSAATAMRTIHDRKQSNQLEINEAGLETAQKFSWTNTAKTLIQHLS